MLGRSVQQRIYLEGLLGRKPPVPVHPEALEKAASKRMSPEAFAYVAGGAGLERTMAANRQAFDRYRLLPRMLRGAKPPGLEVELWGRRWAAPLFLCPIGVLELAHPEADLAAARAAARTGVPFMVSNQSSYPLERVVAAAREANPEAVVFFQLYHSTDRRVVQSFLRRAEEVGCAGVVLTVDTVQLGWRPRDLDLAHLPFLKGQGIAQYLTDPAFLGALDEPLEGPPFRPKPTLALLKNLLALRQTGKRYGLDLSRMQKAVRRFVATYSFPELSWEDVERVREATRLPLLLKGLLHPEDAVRAVALGADGVYVSNHGGRQVDGSLAALEALPAIARAVGDKVPVLMDSGVRTGADAVKALALGAGAVGLGRPYAYGLALGGEEGVRAVLAHVLAELELTLALSGVRSLEELGPHLLVRENPPPQEGGGPKGSAPTPGPPRSP
jgi:lactate 2-monooxygenase